LGRSTVGSARWRSICVPLVAVSGRQCPLRLALAETVREARLENFLDLSCGGCSSGSGQEGHGLNVGPVHNLGRGDGVQNGLSLVLGRSLHPDRRDSGRLNAGHEGRHGNMIGHGFCLGRSLDGGHLVGNSGSLGLQHGLGVIDDLRADPYLGEGCRVNDSAQLSFCHKVRLSLLESLGSGVCLCIRLGVDVRLGLRLSCGESMLESLGFVDDLGRHPHASRWHDFNRSIDLGARHLLYLGDMLGLRHELRDSGRYDLGLNHRFHNRVVNGLCDHLVLTVLVVDVEDRSCITSPLVRVPRFSLTTTRRRLFVTVTAIQTLVTSRLVGRVWHHIIEICRGCGRRSRL